MYSLLEFINNNIAFIAIGLAVMVVISFIVLIILIVSISKLKNRYKQITRGVNNKNLEELVTGYLKNVDDALEICNENKDLVAKFEDQIKQCVQKLSIVRYRAFEDVGSDLSYSMAILDGNNTGVIMTGIFGRNETTTYAKPILRGKSKYELSEEEKKALIEAISK